MLTKEEIHQKIQEYSLFKKKYLAHTYRVCKFLLYNWEKLNLEKEFLRPYVLNEIKTFINMYQMSPYFEIYQCDGDTHLMIFNRGSDWIINLPVVKFITMTNKEIETYLNEPHDNKYFL